MWNIAFKEEVGVGRQYLGRYGVNEFDREAVYAEIYTKRRKIGHVVGYTLNEHFERVKLDAEKAKLAAQIRIEERLNGSFYFTIRDRSIDLDASQREEGNRA